MATQVTKSMVSEASICSQALRWLGLPNITSLDEKVTRAEWMRDNYQFLRDAVLESRAWTFATARAVSTTADMDAWGQMYAHDTPLNWLSVKRVFVDGYGTLDETWRKEGDKVLSCQSTIYLWGLEQVTDTNLFTSLFVQALAARIAADAAIPLKADRQLQVDMWNLYEAKLTEATAVDGQQGSNERIRSSSLIDARRGGGYLYDR